MIEITNLTKRFGSITAVDNLSTKIAPGGVFGLVGINGSGKSTLLRLIAGVYHPDEGSVKLYGEEVYDNQEAKKHIVYVPDSLRMVTPGATMNRAADFYASCYPSFSYEKFKRYTALFSLDPKAKIKSFSKGMGKQAQTVLALACNTDIIMFDETYDGLDPLAKKAAAKAIYSEMCDRQACVIMTSHSLRELEDTCDSLALMYKSRLVLQSDVAKLKTNLFKVQLAMGDVPEREDFTQIPNVELLSFSKNGKVVTLTMRGDKNAADTYIRAMNPILYEMIPLSLEEVFAFEMDALGYKYENIDKEETAGV